MTCPICGGSNTVIGSKQECDAIHRRRRCDECGHIFYTEEYEARTSENYDRLMREYETKRRNSRKVRRD